MQGALQGSTALTPPTTVTFEVHDAQRIILADDHRFQVLDCGRRFGKDHLAAIKVTAHSLAHASPRGGKRYAVINPSYNPQGKETFRVFRLFLESGGLLRRAIETAPMELRLVNGDIVFFFTMESEDNLRGGQYDGIIINEAGLIANLHAKWYEIFEPMLIDRQGWAWIMGTPKGKNDFFTFFMRGQEEFTKDGLKNDWKSFRFPTHANPFIKREELERLKREMPEDLYRQEILAEFLDTGGTVFRGLAAMSKRSEGLTLLPQADACRVGVDLGRHQDFTVLVALSPDNKVIGFDRFNQIDWEIQKQRIKSFCQRFRGKVILDSTGLGDPIHSALTAMGLNVSGTKITNDRKRQLVQNLQLLIEDGVLFVPHGGQTTDPARDLAPLWKELQVYTYDITAGGNIKYGAPAGFHDDCVTALLLAASELPPLASSAEQWGKLDLDDVREVGESYADLGLSDDLD